VQEIFLRDHEHPPARHEDAAQGLALRLRRGFKRQEGRFRATVEARHRGALRERMEDVPHHPGSDGHRERRDHLERHRGAGHHPG